MPQEPIALTPEKQTLLALRALRRRVEELEQAEREPIAIVGMACRLPGGVDHPDEYWKLLMERRNAVTEIPRERLDLKEVSDPHPQTPGKTYSRWAGLLASPGDFDAEFFGISPREALTADPQQRLLLEASWEALENAGIDPQTLAGQDAGVFIGICMAEYAQHYQNCMPKEALAAHFLQGSALNAASGRLSYFYGLQGPSMAIDTACSSSLVAIDRACRSLMQRETSLAIAGGVNLLVTDGILIMASQWGMLSPRGACRAFDREADGFVRAEGCGVVVLKRLKDAQADGDRVLAVILGSAVNQDGASSGLTVPNGQAQQELVRRALHNAAVEPWQVGYVEAHGTGTALGDPIEAEALGAVFAAAKKRERPLLLGSVKTNLGHLEAAAGVAGLIKVVLGLQHNVIPGQLYAQQPSERVRWSELPLEVLTEAREWDAIEGRRIAGVSSFGFSGTNAHVVVEGPPEIAEAETTEVAARPAEILVITARTSPALRTLAERYAEFLERSEARWQDICHTAATGRAVFAERLAVVAGDKFEAAKLLREWLRDESAGAGVSRGRIRAGERVRTALVLGRELEALDGLIEIAGEAAAAREKVWEGKWRSWGLDPVTVTRSAAVADLAAAHANLGLVLGSVLGKELSLPLVRVTGEGGWSELAGAIAALFVRGVKIDWHGWASGFERRRVDLPPYAFQRERYWVEAGPGKRQLAGQTTGCKLLGRRLRAAGVRAQFETELSPQGPTKWIAEHRVQGRAVLPATGHLELMLEAAAEVFEPGAVAIVEDAVLQAPLSIEQPQAIQVVVEAVSAGRSRVRLYSESAADEWQTVSEGWIRAAEEPFPPSLDLEEIQARLEQQEIPGFYAGMAARGLEFGAGFRGLTGLWSGPDEALGEVRMVADEDGYLFAPWRLDACLQAVGPLLGSSDDLKPALYLPLSLERLQVYGTPGECCWSYVHTRRIDSGTLSADITVTRPNGSPLAVLKNLRLRKRASRQAQTAIYGVDWIPAEPDSQPAIPALFDGHWVVFARGNGMGLEIAREIRQRGAACSVILPEPNEYVTEEVIYSVGSGGEREMAELLRKLAADSGPLSGIVHAWGAGGDDAELRTELPQESSSGYGSALTLLQALIHQQIRPARGVWFVTRCAQAAQPLSSAEGRAIWALRRTAAVEFPELHTHSVDIAAESDAAGLLHAIAARTEAELALRKGAVLKPLLQKRTGAAAGSASEEDAELKPAASGLIDHLAYLPALRKPPLADEIEIEVQAHGLNFRDVMNSLGMLPGLPQQLGAECAGVIVRAGKLSGLAVGDRVFAFALGSFRKFVTVPARNAAKVPAGLSLAQAAALPVVYLTALLGLDRLAKLRRGERILIHSAAGGLGLAAVYVARARGAEIYATAGSEEKRAYLRSIGIEHVLPSRTTGFAAEVMRLTHGHGVDVVLNSLTGALAESTLSVLSTGGRFLEVGKRDVLTAEQVRRSHPQAQYFKYDLAEEAGRDPSLIPELLAGLLEMLGAGSLPPLPVTEFADPREAFRFMAQARHTGKIVVAPGVAGIKAHSATIDPAATYLITGGRGGLGLYFAEWLVKRGARHLLLLSRRGPSAVAEETIIRLRAAGAHITTASVDVTDGAALETILRRIPAEAPLKGILHAAGVLHDRSLLNQTFASFVEVARPKWLGAWNLHALTQGLPLDFFVLFSSAAALIGMPGQSNYAAANAMLDALAEYRRSQGLPALSIAWGPWSGAGMAATLHPENSGLGWITPEEGTAALETLLAGEEAVAAVLPIPSWAEFVGQRPRGTSSLFASLVDVARLEAGRSSPDDRPIQQEKSKQAQGTRLADLLDQALPPERHALLAEHLRQQTIQILSLPAQTFIDQETALHDLGLDSLMAVELRNALQISLDRQLSPTLVLDYPTLRALRDALLREIFGEEKPGQTIQPAVSGLSIDELTDSEAEALLLEELEKQTHAARR